MIQEQWYFAGRSLVAAYARWILKADIQHKSSIPAGAKIFVANHPSTSDPAWITVLVSEQVSILIKDLLFKIPLFGQSLRFSGHIPVSPENGKAALNQAVARIQAGRSVVVFPEGEISPRGGYKRPHTGAARLALMTGAPVVPIGIGLDHNNLRIIPARVKGMLDEGYWYLNGPYAMTVGCPFNFQGDAEDRVQVGAVLDQIMHQVNTLALDSFTRVRLARPAQVSVGSMVSVGWQLFGRLFYQLSSI
jgi:1-acyl-sn-glycerol-3-phosphate acyltransferase